MSRLQDNIHLGPRSADVISEIAQTVAFFALNPLAKILHVDSIRQSLEGPLKKLHSAMIDFGEQPYSSLFLVSSWYRCRQKKQMPADA